MIANSTYPLVGFDVHLLTSSSVGTYGSSHRAMAVGYLIFGSWRSRGNSSRNERYSVSGRFGGL